MEMFKSINIQNMYNTLYVQDVLLYMFSWEYIWNKSPFVQEMDWRRTVLSLSVFPKEGFYILSHTPHCFEGVSMMFVNRPWAIHVL